MQSVRSWLGLAAPLALLGASTAVAQQPVQPREVDPSSNEAAQTRELERDIEQYPGPSDDAADTRIPEQIHPAPKKPATTPRPHAASPSSPTRGATPSAIDPSEVQRVFGSDAVVIPLGSLTAERITRLQLRLHELGHYQGEIDGVVGPQTRAALASYARAQFALKQRLLKQDQITTDLAEQLGVEPRATPGSRSPAPSDDTGPAMPGDAPQLPPGGAPLPPPGMTPLPTPSSSPSGMPPDRSGATPVTPPPSP